MKKTIINLILSYILSTALACLVVILFGITELLAGAIAGATSFVIIGMPVWIWLESRI